jgi:inner membrane protein
VATPIGHSLAGYAVYGHSQPSVTRSRVSLIVLCVIMANLPDIDFLPGILAGNPSLYHQGPTHSFAFALLASLAAAGFLALARLPGSSSSSAPGISSATVFTLVLLSHGSHLLIDFFGADRLPPYGLPLLWPLSDAHFRSPVPLFPGVHHTRVRSDSTLQWIDNVLSLRNLGAVGVEILWIGPVVLLGRRRSRRRTAPTG